MMPCEGDPAIGHTFCMLAPRNTSIDSDNAHLLMGPRMALRQYCAAAHQTPDQAWQHSPPASPVLLLCHSHVLLSEPCEHAG